MQTEVLTWKGQQCDNHVIVPISKLGLLILAKLESFLLLLTFVRCQRRCDHDTISSSLSMLVLIWDSALPGILAFSQSFRHQGINLRTCCYCTSLRSSSHRNVRPRDLSTSDQAEYLSKWLFYTQKPDRSALFTQLQSRQHQFTILPMLGRTHFDLYPRTVADDLSTPRLPLIGPKVWGPLSTRRCS